MLSSKRPVSEIAVFAPAPEQQIDAAGGWGTLLRKPGGLPGALRASVNRHGGVSVGAVPTAGAAAASSREQPDSGENLEAGLGVPVAGLAAGAGFVVSCPDAGVSHAGGGRR